jgi:hypothetical protein
MLAAGVAHADDDAVAKTAWELALQSRWLVRSQPYSNNPPLKINELEVSYCYNLPECAADCGPTLEWAVGHPLDEERIANGHLDDKVPRPARLCTALAGAKGENATPADLRQSARQRMDRLIDVSSLRVSGNARNQIDCARAILRGRALPQVACRRAEEKTLQERVALLVDTDSASRVLMAARDCAQLDLCNSDCPEVFAAISTLLPARFPAVTPACVEMKPRVGESAMEWADRGMQWVADRYAALILWQRKQ